MTRPVLRHVPPFVDTHVHFFDLGVERLRWDWLEDTQPGKKTLFEDLVNVRTRRFTPRELLREASRLGGMQTCVHVQAAMGTEDPVDETRWIQALHEEHGVPAGHIAHVPMATADAFRIVDAHLEQAITRGARDPGSNGVLQSTAFIANAQYLGRHDLAFEIFCPPRRYDDLAALADRAPNTRFVLEHFGLPGGFSEEALHTWRQKLVELARRDNVWIKLSGLGLIDPNWTWEAARRLVAEAVEAFGSGRCVVGSNWPIDRASSSYPDAVRAIAQDFSDGEQTAILWDNAVELYRLHVAQPDTAVA